MAKETLFGGDWRKVLIKVILLLLVLLLFYGGVKKLIAWLMSGKDRAVVEDVLQLQIDNPPIITDDSTPSDPETISNSEALDVANKLDTAMTGWGTDNDLMFNYFKV